jgi:hypothetical protein
MLVAMAAQAKSTDYDPEKNLGMPKVPKTAAAYATFAATVPAYTDTYHLEKTEKVGPNVKYTYVFDSSNRKGATTVVTSQNAAIDALFGGGQTDHVEPTLQVGSNQPQRSVVLEYVGANSKKGTATAVLIQFVEPGPENPKVKVSVPKSGDFYVSAQAYYTLAATEKQDIGDAFNATANAAQQTIPEMTVVMGDQVNLADSRVTDTNYKTTLKFQDNSNTLLVNHGTYTISAVQPVSVTPRVTRQDM